VTVRRLVLLVGAVLLVAGVIALLVPVSTPDGNGGSIGCGSALSADLFAAREANSKTVANVPILNQVVPHNDYVAQCQSAVSQRRAWSIPVAVIGVVVMAGALLVGAAGGESAQRLRARSWGIRAPAGCRIVHVVRDAHWDVAQAMIAPASGAAPMI
jgi:hypothetical protein